MPNRLGQRIARLEDVAGVHVGGSLEEILKSLPPGPVSMEAIMRRVSRMSLEQLESAIEELSAAIAQTNEQGEAEGFRGQ